MHDTQINSATNARSLQSVATVLSDWLNEEQPSFRDAQSWLLYVLEFIPAMRSCKSCNSGMLIMPHRREYMTEDMSKLLMTYHCDECDEFFHGNAFAAGAGDGHSPELNLVIRPDEEALSVSVSEVQYQRYVDLGGLEKSDADRVWRESARR